jgi:amino acid adenylation domain-containing protein
VRRSSIRLGAVSVLPAEERREIIQGWNQTAHPYRDDVPIHHLFEERVQATPMAPALKLGETGLSYQELDRHASRLAARLREMGVAAGSPVAVAQEPDCLSRVVALVGILKAGAAYLPVDITYPDQRVAFMFSNAGSPLVITSPSLAARMEAFGCPTLVLDDRLAGLPELPEKAGAPVAVPPEAPAYIIYTSGSTGKPKGVVSGHRGLVNRLEWMRARYDVQGSDRILHRTSVGFDVSMWELLLPLISGACMVIAGRDAQRDMTLLIDLIQRERITVMHFVPSLLEAFIETPGAEACRSLRVVICSGEVLSKALERRFFQKLDCGLHNLYGPTEASIDVTSWECRPDDPRKVVPIGRPIWNTRIHVLDDQMEPVPVGVTGNLYIGGVGLAQGYLNRKDLTQERFIPDPFAEDPKARLYATGDLARYAEGGVVEFVGRRDHQVKIRGFRIELGEIEAVLQGHPAVRAAVVRVHEEGGARKLVAYVVAREGEHTGELEPAVRTHLAQGLPDYMVPSLFVWLEAMPLNASGKVDRDALPAPREARASRPEGSEAPRTATERILAEIWGELLGREQVGVGENFFQIGGDSITSIRVVARARQRGLILTVKQLFEAPTIAGLSRLAKLEGAEEGAEPRARSPAAPRAGDAPGRRGPAGRDGLAGHRAVGRDRRLPRRPRRRYRAGGLHLRAGAAAPRSGRGRPLVAALPHRCARR